MLLGLVLNVWLPKTFANNMEIPGTTAMSQNTPSTLPLSPHTPPHTLPSSDKYSRVRHVYIPDSPEHGEKNGTALDPATPPPQLFLQPLPSKVI